MTAMDNTIALYATAIIAQQTIEIAKKKEVPDYENGGTKMVPVEKYKRFNAWNGEPNLHVDEYSNGNGILGYMIRAYEDENVKIIDYGNGGFDTDGWETINA